MDDQQLEESPLGPLHERAGARMAAFAGWRMPISFEGTIAEHEAVRTRAGVFDVSHLGTVFVEGDSALEVVAAVFTNDPAELELGEAQYTLCCDEDGGIVDDCILYHLPDGRFLAVPNAANVAAVYDRLHAAAFDVGDRWRTAEITGYAILAVQGPDALQVAGEVLDLDLAGLDYLGVREVDAAGEVTPLLPRTGSREQGSDEVVVSGLIPPGGWIARTGYTGERGCELVVPGDAAADIWTALVDAGAVPCGLGARDTLRLEMGYPLHGSDIDRTTTPYEARLGWAVKLDRGPFTGQEALRAASEGAPARRLWGLRTDSRRPPRAGMTVLDDGDEAGAVTSGSFSPVLGCGIGLAYLAAPLGPGDRVTVDVRGSEQAFDVVRPPFVDRDPRG